MFTQPIYRQYSYDQTQFIGSASLMSETKLVIEQQLLPKETWQKVMMPAILLWLSATSISTDINFCDSPIHQIETYKPSKIEAEYCRILTPQEARAIALRALDRFEKARVSYVQTEAKHMLAFDIEEDET